MSNEIEDRRQRAYEAYADMIVGGGVTAYPAKQGDCVEHAIETATRVQITPEIQRAYIEAWYRGVGMGEGSIQDAVISELRDPSPWRTAGLAGLAGAFRAAGFEVVP